MTRPKKINTTDFLNKVKKMVRERIAEAKVVPLQSFRPTKKSLPHNILLIEDDESMRNAMVRLLESDGYKVIAVADSTFLTQTLDDTPIDLVILDVELPWINGFELAELMKQDPDLTRIPFIFVSGRTSETDIKRGFDLGALDFIKKPFELDTIRQKVRTLLELNKTQ